MFDVSKGMFQPALDLPSSTTLRNDTFDMPNQLIYPMRLLPDLRSVSNIRVAMGGDEEFENPDFELMPNPSSNIISKFTDAEEFKLRTLENTIASMRENIIKAEEEMNQDIKHRQELNEEITPIQERLVELAPVANKFFKGFIPVGPTEIQLQKDKQERLELIKRQKLLQLNIGKLNESINTHQKTMDDAYMQLKIAKDEIDKVEMGAKKRAKPVTSFDVENERRTAQLVASPFLSRISSGQLPELKSASSPRAPSPPKSPSPSKSPSPLKGSSSPDGSPPVSPKGQSLADKMDEFRKRQGDEPISDDDSDSAWDD
jgi:hypothetical protein